MEFSAAEQEQPAADEDVHPSLLQKAAHFCFGLIKKHPFADGNKHIGAHVMLVFLALNGIELQYTQTELSDIILPLAAGAVQSSDLLNWILTHQLKKVILLQMAFFMSCRVCAAYDRPDPGYTYHSGVSLFYYIPHRTFPLSICNTQMVNPQISVAGIDENVNCYLTGNSPTVYFFL